MRRTIRLAVFAAFLAAAPALSQQPEQKRVVNPAQTIPVQSGAEKPSQAENQKNSAGDTKLGVDERQRASATPQIVYPQVESVMEGGVQVVRRSGGTPATVAQVDANQASGSPAGAATLAPMGTRAVSAYPLVRVRMADNWKYSKSQRTAGTQRAQLWEYKERRHRTYQPRPQRGPDEVDRLTRYRRTQD